ncbi:MAG: helix-turn-helix domain-containing protein [Actinomycetota bacterium]|nr:helix-turn-helix domain-containing protein [Actinomycetota bacterium]
MTRTLYDRTVLPPDETEPLTKMLAAMRDEDGAALLVGPEDVRLKLPVEAYRVLRGVLEAMANGLAITIVPQYTMLTTQEAADLLGISRPTLVKLLQGGEIAYEQRGRHRRLLLTDVLDYQRRSRSERKAHLDALVDEAGDQGLYEATAAPRPTR